MVKSAIDFQRKDINQLFVVVFLSFLDGATSACIVHQRILSAFIFKLKMSMSKNADKLCCVFLLSARRLAESMTAQKQKY